MKNIIISIEKDSHNLIFTHLLIRCDKNRYRSYIRHYIYTRVMRLNELLINNEISYIQCINILLSNYKKYLNNDTIIMLEKDIDFITNRCKKQNPRIRLI